jgi:hypothetical protein
MHLLHLGIEHIHFCLRRFIGWCTRAATPCEPKGGYCDGNHQTRCHGVDKLGVRLHKTSTYFAPGRSSLRYLERRLPLHNYTTSTNIDNKLAVSRSIFPKSLIFIDLRLRLSHRRECEIRIRARIARMAFQFGDPAGIVYQKAI